MLHRRTFAAACLAACAMVAHGIAQQPPRDTSALPSTQTTAQPAGRVSGRVVAADTGRPIRRARVLLRGSEIGGRATLTDDTGAYDFSELPAGRYSVTASKNGYIQLSYGQRRPLQPGTPLQLGEGEQLKGVDFGLPRGGVISGRVSDDTGDVMAGVSVQVLRYQYMQGDRRLIPAGQAQTDDRGMYRVWGLNPGDYYVSATARNEGLGGRGFGRGGPGPAAGRGGRGGGFGGFGAGGEDQDQLMYAPTYYPGVGSAADARAVTVGVSQEVNAIDFALELVQTARVSGHVENPDGSWTARGTVTLVPQGNARAGLGGAFGGRIGWDGLFSIGNVPPGLYTLRARNNDRDAPLSTSQPLSVSGGDLSDVVVILQDGGTLSGSLAFEPGANEVPSDLTQIRVTAPATEPDDNIGPQPNPRVNKDGTFTVEGVSVGEHVIRAGGGLHGWNLKAVTVDGRDVTDTPIEIRSGQTIRNVVLTFTDKVNEINGTLTDARGEPVTEYTVLAFSTDSSLWRPQSRQIATARPDQTGKYTIRNLPAGEYYLVTVDPSEPGEWFEPDYLDQHRAGATRVSLGEGDVRTQDFRVSR